MDANEQHTRRLVVMMQPSVVEAIREFMFSNRFEGMSEATRELIRVGLEASSRR